MSANLSRPHELRGGSWLQRRPVYPLFIGQTGSLALWEQQKSTNPVQEDCDWSNLCNRKVKALHESRTGKGKNKKKLKPTRSKKQKKKRILELFMDFSLWFMKGLRILSFTLLHSELPGVRSFLPASMPPSLQLFRIELSRLQALCLTNVVERVREVKGLGEEGDREGVRVVGEEEQEEDEEEGDAEGVGEDDWLLGRGRAAARCSRRRR